MINLDFQNDYEFYELKKRGFIETFNSFKAIPCSLFSPFNVFSVPRVLF